MSRPIRTLVTAAAGVLLLAGVAFGQASSLANCKYYTKTQQDFAQGLPYCRECIEEEPDNPEARYFGAWCLAEMGEYEAAWESFEWLLDRQDSRDKKIRKHAKWASERVQAYFANHFNQGVEYLNGEDYASARDEFRKATEINPQKAAGFLNYGFTLNQLGEQQAAIESFRKAVEIAPDQPVGYEYLSVALANRIDELRESANADTAEVNALRTELYGALEKVLENDPANDAALINLADLELEKGNTDEAFTYIEKAVQIDPGNLTTLYNKGVTFYQAQNWDAAIQAFGKTAELVDDPSEQLWLDSMFNKAVCEQSDERWEAAIATSNELIEVDPTNADYYGIRAKARMKTGQKEAALEDYKKVEELSAAAVEG
jgi:tetratricopeptide (TPR) repeat protein